MGNRWCEIAKNIEGRSENAVKNRWNAAQRRARAAGTKVGAGGKLGPAPKPKKPKKPKVPRVKKPKKKKTPTTKRKRAPAAGSLSSRKRARNKAPKMVLSPSASSGPADLSGLADIGHALTMVDILQNSSASPIQSPTRPATPPTSSNARLLAANILAGAFERVVSPVPPPAATAAAAAAAAAAAKDVDMDAANALLAIM